jgi:hypothetical protein
MLQDATNVDSTFAGRISGASAASSQESNPSEFKIGTTFMFRNPVFVNRDVFFKNFWRIFWILCFLHWILVLLVDLDSGVIQTVICCQQWLNAGQKHTVFGSERKTIVPMAHAAMMIDCDDFGAACW